MSVYMQLVSVSQRTLELGEYQKDMNMTSWSNGKYSAIIEPNIIMVTSEILLSKSAK